MKPFRKAYGWSDLKSRDIPVANKEMPHSCGASECAIRINNLQSSVDPSSSFQWPDRLPDQVAIIRPPLVPEPGWSDVPKLKFRMEKIGEENLNSCRHTRCRKSLPDQAGCNGNSHFASVRIARGGFTWSTDRAVEQFGAESSQGHVFC